jgi:hypothetical protein
VPVVLQKSFRTTLRKRAQNVIPGNGMKANTNSRDERGRMGFYPSSTLSEVRAAFATKSAKS